MKSTMLPLHPTISRREARLYGNPIMTCNEAC